MDKIEGILFMLIGITFFFFRAMNTLIHDGLVQMNVWGSSITEYGTGYVVIRDEVHYYATYSIVPYILGVLFILLGLTKLGVMEYAQKRIKG